MFQLKLLSTRRIVAALALIVTGTLFAEDSNAAYAVSHAYPYCQNDFGVPNAFVSGGNILPANSLIITCPVTDSTDILRKTLTTLSVYYDDENSTTNLLAERCVDYENAIGGSCGNTVSSSGTGVSSMNTLNTPSTFAADWNANLHFGYVLVILPNQTGSAPSRIKGLFEVRP